MSPQPSTSALTTALLAALAQAGDARDVAVQRALQRLAAPPPLAVTDTFVRTGPGAPPATSAPLQVVAGLPLLAQRPWGADDLAVWHRELVPRATELLDDATTVVARAGVRAELQASATAYVLLCWTHSTLPPDLAVRSAELQTLLAGSLPPAVLAAVAAQLPVPHAGGGPSGVLVLPAGVSAGTLVMLVGLLAVVVLLWWLT